MHSLHTNIKSLIFHNFSAFISTFTCQHWPSLGATPVYSELLIGMDDCHVLTKFAVYEAVAAELVKMSVSLVLWVGRIHLAHFSGAVAPIGSNGGCLCILLPGLAYTAISAPHALAAVN